MTLWPFPIGTAATLHLLVFGLLLPVAGARSYRRLRTIPLPPRPVHFLSVTVQQLVFLGFAVWVARREGIVLFPPVAPGVPDLLLGAAVTAALVALLRGRWRQSIERRERAAYLFMPWTAGERRLWAAVSAAAGLAEEVAYRGVLVAILARLAGSPLAAVPIAALLFGLAHGVQGRQSAVTIGGVALVFHGLVLVTGTLYVAIAVHFAYDLLAGLSYGRLGKELGYPRDGYPPEGAEPAPVGA